MHKPRNTTTLLCTTLFDDGQFLSPVLGIDILVSIPNPAYQLLFP
jgi:hypothetical protein